MEAGTPPKHENFASETIMLTRMSARGFLPCSALLPFFMLTGPIVWKNNMQQCFTALEASANKRWPHGFCYAGLTKCHVCIFQHLTPEKPNACFTVWRRKKKDTASAERHRQTDRWTEEGSACQMSMGKWTMRDSNGMKQTQSQKPAWTRHAS